MDLPPTARIVECRTNDFDTIILSIAIEGEFPMDRKLINFSKLYEIGAFVRNPMNPKYDPPSLSYGLGDVRGLTTAEKLPEETEEQELGEL